MNILSTVSEMGFTQSFPSASAQTSTVSVFLDERKTRQVAVYRATADGDWAGWGWVEIESGRQDFRGPEWDQFLGALQPWIDGGVS